MLKIDNLTFSYGKIQALKGVSFEVKQGEILLHCRGKRRGQVNAAKMHCRTAETTGRADFI